MAYEKTNQSSKHVSWGMVKELRLLTLLAMYEVCGQTTMLPVTDATTTLPPTTVLPTTPPTGPLAATTMGMIPPIFSC